jgi:hypothetical protein
MHVSNAQFERRYQCLFALAVTLSGPTFQAVSRAQLELMLNLSGDRPISVQGEVNT